MLRFILTIFPSLARVSFIYLLSRISFIELSNITSYYGPFRDYTNLFFYLTESYVSEFTLLAVRDIIIP